MADDAIQSFIDAYEQSDTIDSHIPVQRIQRCCCGNDACAYLKHNQSALEGLESDVRTAAKLGQALLMRHEAYIAESEKERNALTMQIEALESEKRELETRNTVVIDENRYLLDQLEALNNSVAESDGQVSNLQATLLSTQQELHKLAQLAARTERLEQQLADFEREQAMWQASLDDKDEAEKSAMRRWQQAERTLATLQEQIERIEREAREEKERHVEVVGRMERRHTVERELTSAAGRLKGAAAAKTAGRDPGGTNVVSHFVKDILQDNTNLQMGIIELRELLQNSNDEVESLRKRLDEHKPADVEIDDEFGKSTIRRKDLQGELERASSQELHVHHHYHAPNASKLSTIRRPKKKRYGVLTPGHFTPPSGYSTPRSSVSYGTPSSAATILQQTAVTVPRSVPPLPKRFSTQSSQTYHSTLSSSGPSSPQSTTNRTSSIFDRVFSDAGHDSSRPTTPDTEDPGSPLVAPVDAKRTPSVPSRTYSAPIVQPQGISLHSSRPSFDSVLSTSAESVRRVSTQSTDHDTIPEEDESDWEIEASTALEEDSSVTSPCTEDATESLPEPALFYKQPLRRAASHESLLSISGMDIHTLQSRPSQLLAPHGARSFTSQAVLTDAHAHAARPAIISRTSDSSRSLLSGMAADQRQAARPNLGQKVGGWVFGRWGSTPAPSTLDPTTTEATNAGKPPSRSSASDLPPEDVQARLKKPKVRPPGINQSGPIFGFAPEVKKQHLPIMKSLDEEALRKALGDT